jgi:hypothetical protein
VLLGIVQFNESIVAHEAGISLPAWLLPADTRGTDGGEGDGCFRHAVYGVCAVSAGDGGRRRIAAGAGAAFAGPDFANSLLPVALLIVARALIA